LDPHKVADWLPTLAEVMVTSSEVIALMITTLPAVSGARLKVQVLAVIVHWLFELT
jgi:hypothetical protein